MNRNRIPYINSTSDLVRTLDIHTCINLGGLEPIPFWQVTHSPLNDSANPSHSSHHLVHFHPQPSDHSLTSSRPP